MGLMDEVKKVVDNVKDSLSESAHKSEAEGERAKRDLAGDAMTPGEKAGSLFNEAKNDIQGETDAAKRDIRNA
jgi:ElaB/YqjD/DUF883 family membrane-anchored ribosome-binding protein